MKRIYQLWKGMKLCKNKINAKNLFTTAYTTINVLTIVKMRISLKNKLEKKTCGLYMGN